MCDSADIAPRVPFVGDRPSFAQLAVIAAAVAAVASLRIVVGPSNFQGLLFVIVTAVAAWRVGVRAGVAATLLGLLAAHVLRVVADPSILTNPGSLLTRQYVAGITSYMLLSAAAVTVGRRHQITVRQLAAATRENREAERQHTEQLEAALARERAARLDAEALIHERERLLAQLSRELQRATDLAAIVESSDDAIIAADLTNTVTSWNKAAETLFGYSAEEMVGSSLNRIIPEERHAEDRQVTDRVANGETVLHFETARRRRDGSPVEISLTISPIRDSSRAVVGASRIGRDVTQRRLSEKNIAELQARLVALTAASGTLLRSLTVDDVVKATLVVARDLLPADAYAVWRRHRPSGDWRAEAVSGLSPRFISSVTPDSSAPEILAPLPIADVSTEPRLARRRQAHADEGVASLLLVPFVSDGRTAGSAVFYYRSLHTFSEGEMHAARAFGNLGSAAFTTAILYEQQQKSRLESEFLAEAGILLADSLQYADTLKQLAGLAVPYFADFCAVDLVTPSGRLERLAVQHRDPELTAAAEGLHRTYPEDPDSPYTVTHAMRTGKPLLVERLPMELATTGSARMRAGMTALGIRSFLIVPMVIRGTGVGALTFALTGTARQYGADDLRFASAIASRAALAVENARAYEAATGANRLKDEFLATLSHELRTPLNAVLGYARMLNEGVLAGDRLRRALAVVERNALALVRLVEDVLDVSRLASDNLRLTLKDIDFSAVVGQALTTLRPTAEGKGVRLSSKLDGPALPLRGDADRLQQVTWNLVGNALKFTPGGGTVHVETAVDETDAVLTIRDTGCGIAPEFLPHVFERFRQGDARLAREHGGLGLGLAIARDIVRLHGGTITASSAGPGSGATFEVRIPLRAAPRVAPTAAPSAAIHVRTDERDDPLSTV
jgi:PAS domain S-box-containing protein